ncbi:MAG: oligosaccharide repeat unit polymerase [Fermentimonas sp.]|jgi:oligosaccharide repeat unit polymerase
MNSNINATYRNKENIEGKLLISISFQIIYILFLLLSSNINLIISISFWICIFFIPFSILINKKIRLIDVWNLAFVFIIISEMVLLSSVTSDLGKVSKYLLLANSIVNIGHTFYAPKYAYRPNFNNISNLSSTDNYPLISKKKNIFIYILIISLAIYFVIKLLPLALTSATLGRHQALLIHGDIPPLTNSIGMFLPCVIAWYSINIRKNKTLTGLLLAAPIFIIQLLIGTRYHLLFSLSGFLFMILKNKKIKVSNIILIILLVIFFIFISDYMLINRTGNPSATIEVTTFSFVDNPEKFLASYMSPEGVVDMTNLMFNHFDNHSHMYGLASSYIFIFWIPRAIWPDKPTMLGYWLIREYGSGFSDSHSASFGFTGDLYADFGNFSLLICFFIGIVIGLLQKQVNKNLQSNSYSNTLFVMLYPATFFYVRSPQTSLISYIGVAVIYLIIKLIIKPKSVNRRYYTYNPNNAINGNYK